MNSSNNFVPIVDSYNSLVGVIYEKDIKKLSYSQYGMSLARNMNIDNPIKKYMKTTISAEISWSIDKILDIYTIAQEDKTGVFITKNNEYYGFIDTNNLLKLSYFRNLEIARDQNPLTKLPGNNQIEKYINNIFQNKDDNKKYTIVYFDFNDFKPFNDAYGFRQGDRAISMFSDILKKESSSNDNFFIGHIGGDDFFCGLEDYSFEDSFKIIKNIRDMFKSNASSLYNKEDRKNGCIKSKDRFGTKREFKLLDVAAAIIEIPAFKDKEHLDEVLHIAKKSAKNSDIPIGISLI